MTGKLNHHWTPNRYLIKLFLLDFFYLKFFSPTILFDAEFFWAYYTEILLVIKFYGEPNITQWIETLYFTNLSWSVDICGNNLIFKMFFFSTNIFLFLLLLLFVLPTVFIQGVKKQQEKCNCKVFLYNCYFFLQNLF